MINNDKWINSLPNAKTKHDKELFQIDNDKWINTIPKKNTFNSVKKYSPCIFTRYSPVFTQKLIGYGQEPTRGVGKCTGDSLSSENSLKTNSFDAK